MAKYASKAKGKNAKHLPRPSQSEPGKKKNGVKVVPNSNSQKSRAPTKYYGIPIWRSSRLAKVVVAAAKICPIPSLLQQNVKPALHLHTHTLDKFKFGQKSALYQFRRPLRHRKSFPMWKGGTPPLSLMVELLEFERKKLSTQFPSSQKRAKYIK